MTTMKEFKSYQKEIMEFIEELKDAADDKTYTKKLVSHIKANLGLIELLDVKTLSDDELEEVNAFVAFVYDVMRKYGIEKESDEPNK